LKRNFRTEYSNVISNRISLFITLIGTTERCIECVSGRVSSDTARVEWVVLLVLGKYRL
jgi:hypothetical protein